MSDEQAPKVEADSPEAPVARQKLVRPVAPAGKPSNIKAYLMWFIILATIGLTAAIGWKLVKKYVLKNKGGNVIDVEKEWKEAFEKAKVAHDKCIDIQIKVWTKGEPLTPEEIETIRKELDQIVEAQDKLHVLFEKIRNRDAKEIDDIAPRLLRVKLWILDAGDVVDGTLNETKMSGLYIPMNMISTRWQKAHAEMKEIGQKRDEILLRNDPDEKERVRKHLSAIQGVITECAEGYGQLVEYIKTGLPGYELKKTDLDELGILIDDQSMMTMAINSIRDLRSKFRD